MYLAQPQKPSMVAARYGGNSSADAINKEKWLLKSM
jgi:hypothetical protein